MRCPMEERVLAYGAGKLDARQARAFEEHLAGCPECRTAAAGQQAVSRALDGWAAPAVSAGFDRRLMARIENEVSWWETLIRPLRPLRIGRVAAMGGLLLLAGLLLQRPDAGTVPVMQHSAQVEAVAPEQAESALVEMDMMREFSGLVHADAGAPRM
jgi:anti-sigma factor RsiW